MGLKRESVRARATEPRRVVARATTRCGEDMECSCARTYKLKRVDLDYFTDDDDTGEITLRYFRLGFGGTLAF
jgi:hypothetical protein